MVNLASVYSRPCALVSINFKTQSVFKTEQVFEQSNKFLVPLPGNQAFYEPNEGRILKR